MILILLIVFLFLCANQFVIFELSNSKIRLTFGLSLLKAYVFVVLRSIWIRQPLNYVVTEASAYEVQVATILVNNARHHILADVYYVAQTLQVKYSLMSYDLWTP